FIEVDATCFNGRRVVETDAENACVVKQFLLAIGMQNVHSVLERGTINWTVFIGLCGIYQVNHVFKNRPGIPANGGPIFMLKNTQSCSHILGFHFFIKGTMGEYYLIVFC